MIYRVKRDKTRNVCSFLLGTKIGCPFSCQNSLASQQYIFRWISSVLWRPFFILNLSNDPLPEWIRDHSNKEIKIQFAIFVPPQNVIVFFRLRCTKENQPSNVCGFVCTNSRYKYNFLHFLLLPSIFILFTVVKMSTQIIWHARSSKWNSFKRPSLLHI